VEGKAFNVKKLMTFGAIVSLAGGLFLAVAGPASAQRRHHHHNRHHKHNTLHCGAGTHRSGNQCVPDQTTSPGTPTTPTTPTTPFPGTFFFGGCTPGSATIQPCTVSLARISPTTGTFSGSFTASGIPPSTSFIVTPFAGAACPMSGGGGPFTSSSFGGFGGGSITFTLASAGCTAGTYPISITETAAPGQTFTGFVTAQLF